MARRIAGCLFLKLARFIEVACGEVLNVKRSHNLEKAMAYWSHSKMRIISKYWKGRKCFIMSMKKK